MARQIAKYGADALKPLLVDGVWRKAKVPAKTAAKLRKEFLAEGKEWPLPEHPKKDTKYGFGLKRKPKGHKFEKKNEQRRKEIQANMEKMPQLIAEYRESQKLKDSSFLDKLLLTVKERRAKQFRVQK